MKNYFIICLMLVLFSCVGKEDQKVSRYNFPAILDISFTPNETERCAGAFTDAVSWWGLTPAR